MYLCNRIKANLPYQSGGNGKFSDGAIPGEIEPNPYDTNIKKYLDHDDYQDIQITFECN